MLLIRRLLSRIRSGYSNDPRRWFTASASAAGLLALGAIAMDSFAPFGGVYNLIRSLILAPTAVAFFVLAYGVSLRMHEARVEADAGWTPFRARYSPSWRRRIAIILGAVLVVVAQASYESPTYTLTASLIGAVVLALLAFVRTSSIEASREELGIPDARDLAYNAEARERARMREQARASKREKRTKFIRGE